MKKAIAIHSYKGGTGKTSVAANLAVIYASEGASVCLLDYDFRAPSLQVLFKERPDRWLNDFLEGDCKIEDALLELSAKYNLKGRFVVGFANPSLKAMTEMMTKDRRWEARALRKTFSAKKEIQEKLGMDYLIFDTSPGAHYASINALAGADVISLVMKADEFDLEGTKQLSRGIYEVLGRKAGMLLNKIPAEQVAEKGGMEEFGKSVEAMLGLPLLGIIPCLCELMAVGGKSIYAVEKPDHIFTKSVKEFAERLRVF